MIPIPGDVEADGSSAAVECTHARTHACTHELRREYFSASPCLSLFFAHSLSLSSRCTDANETTADLRDIYVRFSRTLLLVRRAFSWTTTVWMLRLSFLTLSLPLRKVFLPSRARTEGPFSSLFCSFSFSLSLSHSVSASAAVHMRARPRKHETRAGDGGALERLSPLMQNTRAHTHSSFACARTHVHACFSHVHRHVPRASLV